MPSKRAFLCAERGLPKTYSSFKTRADCKRGGMHDSGYARPKPPKLLGLFEAPGIDIHVGGQGCRIKGSIHKRKKIYIYIHTYTKTST